MNWPTESESILQSLVSCKKITEIGILKTGNSQKMIANFIII